VADQKFIKCNGFKKGCYAIDQSTGYSYNNENEDGSATIWNHSFPKMNQSNGYSSTGNANIVILVLKV